MPDYKVKTEGWLDGSWREAGDILSMAEIAAEHLVAAGQIERVSEKPARGKASPAAAAAPAE